ncbi:MAG: GAF domain-containing protein, partial [Planctomycetia bacterium]|nr:GAF domain-containing protein [Planctomycetia bacterium]
RPEKDASNASAGDGAIEFLIRIPVENSLHRVLGTLVVWKDEKASEYMKESLVTKLAKGVAATVNETYRWVYVLRENKMGQAVRALHPETQPSQKDVPLAEQIRKILKDGARLIVCQAASLYLLDQETTLLNLSACWGLPDDRLTEPPRPLKSARADLEALLGNAVILNEEHLTDYWRVPETFATSLCVPVASDDTILGTLWFFSDSRRRFGVSDMAVIEMIAGRLTAELEKRAIRSDYACFRKLSELERGSSSSSSRAAM